MSENLNTSVQGAIFNTSSSNNLEDQELAVFQKYKQMNEERLKTSPFQPVLNHPCFKQCSNLHSIKHNEGRVQSSQISHGPDSYTLEQDGKRGQYRKYTFEEKQLAVKMISQGYDVKQISFKFNIPRRNLLRWKKNGCQRKQGGGRPTDTQLEEILYYKIWNGEIKSQRLIRQQAKKVSKCQNFKASKGWYCKFDRRYKIWASKQKAKLQKCKSSEQKESIEKDTLANRIKQSQGKENRNHQENTSIQQQSKEIQINKEICEEFKKIDRDE